MSVHIGDSVIFENAWSTPEMRALFDDRAMLRGWIEVMTALAETEAEFGLIPASAAADLALAGRYIELDADFLAEVKEGYEQSNHSLLGLIRALHKRSPGASGEWWCYGATVQDITDSHNARVLAAVRGMLALRLDELASILATLARQYRDTPMCGRTHGQPGLPITFGFKAAGWLDEMHRHRLRLSDIADRLKVGQLSGGVGSLSSFGAEGLALQQRFCDRLGLNAPAISWTAARDRLAEWLNLLAWITGSADRIGHEVYNLQRPEIGELSEGFVAGTVGSITMPQKRNPEIAEHLGTLARSVRYQAAQMNENLVHDHERDGRAWKSEWAIVPPACLATDKALASLCALLSELRVNTARMQGNLMATRGFVHAERVMLELAATLGKQSAHDLVYGIAMTAVEHGLSLHQAVLNDAKIRALLSPERIEDLFEPKQSAGSCAQMVDRVLDEVEAWNADRRQQVACDG
ncbi:MAG: class-II fumarase/aspartase family protein [Gammaproteobacteria bacterium]